jgi:5-methylcytosine-specific restriction protein A
MQFEPLFLATKQAFSDFTKIQIDVLHALLVAPRYSSSAGQLQKLLGLSAVIQVNAALAQAGRKVHKILGYHPDGLSEGQFDWWHILATGQQEASTGFVWTLRPSIISALKDCGLNEVGNFFTDEIQDSANLTEGSYRKVLVNIYERNPIARSKCLAAHGYRCSVCEMDFEAIYGKVAKEFIHVHHLRQLSSIGVEYEIDPIADLRPVCPNCHAVIHMSQPPYTIEQVKEFINKC